MKEIKPIKPRPPQVAGILTTIIFPWPPKELSPNSRVHWAKKSAKAKEVKEIAYFLTIAADKKHFYDLNNKPETITLNITFNPPTNARHDIDNCLSRCKSLIDGISQALGIDDSKFKYTIQMGSKVAGGSVVIDIS